MDEKRKPMVFVVTPFNEDFLALFEEFKRVFGDDFDFTNAGDLDNQQNIIQDIVEGIANADVIIADLTGLNANVFYELGLAHAMSKKVIIITQDIGELPFDIKSYRANQYSLQFNKLPALMEELKKLLNGAINGNIKYGNPVSDYVPGYFLHTAPSAENEQESTTNLQTEHKTEDAEDDDGEDGFLDYIADISQESERMTHEINSMGDDLSKMSESVAASSAEINRVKSSSGSVDPTFARSICRKLATPVGSFGEQMKGRVSQISKSWDKIESSYLNMLDSPFVKTPSHVGDIKGSMNSLQEMQDAIFESNASIDGFIVSLRGCQGIERRLNKSIVALVAVLQDYLTTTETISASVDRIIGKSQIVLKEIHDM